MRAPSVWDGRGGGKDGRSARSCHAKVQLRLSAARPFSVRVAATAAIDKPAPSSLGSVKSPIHRAPAAKETTPSFRVPEDFQLPAGELSTVDRTRTILAQDVFRCFGCTKPECQVRSVFAVEEHLHLRSLPSCMIHTINDAEYMRFVMPNASSE
jgi:hypothetical protein